MEAWQIILIVCGGLLLLFVLFVIIVRKLNRKRYKKLQENLQKFKKENEEFKDNGDDDIFPGLKIFDEDKKSKDSSPIIEEYDPQMPSQEEGEASTKEENENEFDFQRKYVKKENRTNRHTNTDEDFENFMKEHSFSRKVLNTELVEKIRNLSPELKAIILNSVFDKFDDNK